MPSSSTATRETAAASREGPHRIMAEADRLVAALEAAGTGVDWREAKHLAEAVAAGADELGFEGMRRAAGDFVASVRRGAPPHALRNAAQMIVVEHEHLRMTLESLRPA
jgi:hypothetical protein